MNDYSGFKRKYRPVLISLDIGEKAGSISSGIILGGQEKTAFSFWTKSLALVQTVEAMPAERRIVVISGVGDRRDSDIRLQTEILGDVFDEVILYQDDCQWGRADGEVLALLREGLTSASRTSSFEEIRRECSPFNNDITDASMPAVTRKSFGKWREVFFG